MSRNARHERRRGHHRAAQEELDDVDGLIDAGFRTLRERDAWEAAIQRLMADGVMDRDAAEDLLLSASVSCEEQDGGLVLGWFSDGADEVL